MKIMIIGSNGMLGKMLVQVLASKNQEIIRVARDNADFSVDLMSGEQELIHFIKENRPDVIVNAAALIDLKYCEENPGEAYLLNGKLPGVLAEICQEINCYFVQISTDHYYEDDPEILHKETDSIVLVNEYARSKYIGEILTLLNPKALIIRTNIIGFKGEESKPTFIEWVLNSLKTNEVIKGFSDYYTSSIDVEHFSEILHELILKKEVGIINVATKEAYSKYELIYTIAEKKNKQGIVRKSYLGKSNQNIKRAKALGLDTRKLVSIVGEDKVPSMNQVIEWVLAKQGEYNND